MKTLEYIIYAIITVLVFLFMARTTVSFNPFRITFERLWYAIGFHIMMVGFIIVLVHSNLEGRRAGYSKGCEDMIEVVKNEFTLTPKDDPDATK